MQNNLVIIGAGAAGLMAAIAAAEELARLDCADRVRLIVLEKMMFPARKLRITGKGRGNLTNVAPREEFLANIHGGEFLNSSLRAFDRDDLIKFFNDAGVATKIERGGRVFPVSDKAEDLVNALVGTARNGGAEIITASPVAALAAAPLDTAFPEQSADSGKKKRAKPRPAWRINGVRLKNGQFIAATAVIVATGGLSYPATGSSGDGYAWAQALGHTIAPTFPALVPLETEEAWPGEAAGLTLKNVRAALFIDGKKAGDEFGELLFTHFGVSGPIILRLSRFASAALNSSYKDGDANKPTPSRFAGSALNLSGEPPLIELRLDLKPALTAEQLAARLERDLLEYRNKSMKNALAALLPAAIIEPLLDLAYIDPQMAANQLAKERRRALIALIKGLPLTISAVRPYTEAIVTAGGVKTAEVEPKTLASKKALGLYFAGEILDLDGNTGGYNLQAAFSTGRAAGIAAAQYVAGIS